SVDARVTCCRRLVLAAGGGRLDAVRYLLDEGADVNARETSGATALTEAAYAGKLDAVKELLSRDADVNAVSGDGTALDIATKRKYSPMADVLTHNGEKKDCDL